MHPHVRAVGADEWHGQATYDVVKSYMAQRVTCVIH